MARVRSLRWSLLASQQIRDNSVGQLTKLSLGELQRVAFYSVGASFALLLDRAAPDWHARYLDEKFDLDRLLPK